jgi:hypothetical protein
MQNEGTVTGKQMEEFREYVIDSLPRFNRSKLREFIDWNPPPAQEKRLKAS